MRERKERNESDLLTRTLDSEQDVQARAAAQTAVNKESDKTAQGEGAHVEEDEEAMIVEDDVEDETGQGSGANRRDREETVGQPSSKRVRREKKAPEKLNL